MLISIKPTHKTGLKFDLEVPPGTTVAEMKDMIEAAEGISYDYQRYIFKGKLLRSDQTLEECGVQDEDTLHLVLQVMPLGDNAPVDLLSNYIRAPYPAHGAQDVSTDVKIMVSFLSDLDDLERMLIRVGEAWELGQEVPGCTHLVPDSQTVCFIPLSQLKPGTRYYVRCSTNPESLGKAGPSADLAEWWFKTAVPLAPVRLTIRNVNWSIDTQVMFQPTRQHARKAFLGLLERYHGLKENDIVQLRLHRYRSEYDDTLSLDRDVLLCDADFLRLRNGDTVIVQPKAKTNLRAESSTRDKKAAETAGSGDDGEPELYTSIGLGTAVGVGLLVLGLFAMSIRARRA